MANFLSVTFSRKISRFSSAKISDDFFSHRPLISNFPSVFPVSVHFPLFRENYYSPTFKNLPPVLGKFTCFLHALCVFRFPPYFDHDAFIHHPMHVLDAPVCVTIIISSSFHCLIICLLCHCSVLGFNCSSSFCLLHHYTFSSRFP